MENFTEKERIKLTERVVWAINALKTNTDDWIGRYKGYAALLNNKPNKPLYEEAEKSFHEWAPLFLYTNITTAITTAKAKSNKIVVGLRYKGQDVAVLKRSKGKDLEIVFNKGLLDKNEKFWNYKAPKNRLPWHSPEATAFRKHFSACPPRLDGAKRNEEHRCESALLTELSKTTGADKAFKGIQPVRLFDRRFQMKTPFSGSSTNNPKYSGNRGGGIDMLCRTGLGRGTILNVFELKDKYEAPLNVLKQAVLYATFLFKLLKTPEAGSADWWELFGFDRDLPKNLTLNVVAAMPHNPQEREFEPFPIQKDGVALKLHYFYFDIDGNDQISNISSSIGGLS